MSTDGEIFDRLSTPIATWFRKTHGSFTDAQRRCIPRILDRESVLLASPTGSGKTLAGFLGILDSLVKEPPRRAGVRALYVSPLRALTYDIEKNLSQPVAEMGLEEQITIAMRTGDTSTSDRAKFRRKPTSIFLTTPESLAILLCQKSTQAHFRDCQYVIVDELHALAENKRGAHLMLSLERLERLVERPLCRIGLSATVAPLDKVSQFLVGTGRQCHIEEAPAERRSFVDVLSPLRTQPYPPAGWTASRVMKDMAKLVTDNKSVIIFTNTRSGAENICMRLRAELPEIGHAIEAHHSSLDRDLRLEVEDRLKNGELRAVVCSTSLELGIDVGSIDLVVMVSTPKGISRTLQRIGRSGHSIHQTSHGVLVATNINDLFECTVCAEMTRRRQLDEVRILENAYDVIAQHLVGMAMGDGISPDDAYVTLIRAYPFQHVTRELFDRLVHYLKGGGRSLERQYADTFGKIVEVDGKLQVPNKRIERNYLVNIGTIPSVGVVTVFLGRKKLGTIEEAYMKGLQIGDRFVISGRVVELIETGVAEAKVKEAKRGMPSIPRWGMNKMPLSSGLADQVTQARTDLAKEMESNDYPEDTLDWLVETFMISSLNAQAIHNHFLNQQVLSRIPVKGFMLIELFREIPEQEDRDELLHFFFHSLIGRSANDALSRIIAHRLKEAIGGNALVTIDDYGFLLTVQPFQELDLESWRELFYAANAEEDLEAALQGSELVKWQFRGVAQTGLMVPKNLPGKERRIKQLRWSAEILFRVLEEHEPDHPLLQQAVLEAKHTFLDLNRAKQFLDNVNNDTWDLIEVPAVTPFSFGIFASKIKESMMMEDPEEAIERLYQKMEAACKEADKNR